MLPVTATRTGWATFPGFPVLVLEKRSGPNYVIRRFGLARFDHLTGYASLSLKSTDTEIHTVELENPRKGLPPEFSLSADVLRYPSLRDRDEHLDVLHAGVNSGALLKFWFMESHRSSSPLTRLVITFQLMRKRESDVV